MIAVTNALGGVTLRAYDGANNRTNEVVILNGSSYSTNSFSYDQNGLLLTNINPLGFTSSFAYNSFGQVTNTVDVLNHSSTNFYDLNTGSLLGTVNVLGGRTAGIQSAQERPSAPAIRYHAGIAGQLGRPLLGAPIPASARVVPALTDPGAPGLSEGSLR
jgi:YD repeat-containing protein